MSVMAKYDEIGSGYNYRRQVDPRVLPALMEQLQVTAGAKILDVGHENVEWANGVAEYIPFQDQYFDAVYCTLATHHFPDQMKAYHEIFRVLKQNGRFVSFTADPCRVSADFWMRDYFAELFTADEKIFPATADLTKQLEQVGFRQVQIRPFLIPHDVYGPMRKLTAYDAGYLFVAADKQ